MINISINKIFSRVCAILKKNVNNSYEQCYNGVYEYFECKRLQNVELTQYLLQNVVFMIAEKHDNGWGNYVLTLFILCGLEA